MLWLNFRQEQPPEFTYDPSCAAMPLPPLCDGPCTTATDVTATCAPGASGGYDVTAIALFEDPVCGLPSPGIAVTLDGGSGQLASLDQPVVTWEDVEPGIHFVCIKNPTTNLTQCVNVGCGPLPRPAGVKSPVKQF